MPPVPSSEKSQGAPVPLGKSKAPFCRCHFEGDKDMTRSAALVSTLSFAVVVGAGHADAAEPVQTEFAISAEWVIALFTLFLVVATVALWLATKQLAESTKGLQNSAEKQSEDMQDSLDLTRDSLKFASGQLESANAQRAKNLGDQLFEFDKVLISNPSLQIELEKLRDSPAKFHAMENKECFVKVKSFIYMHLNFFDEIVSTYEGKSEDSVEYKDWCTYIVEKMKHPAYKDVMENERKIFGGRIRQFFEDNRKEIYKDNGTPWQW
jgi:hypothetical protein